MDVISQISNCFLCRYEIEHPNSSSYSTSHQYQKTSIFICQILDVPQLGKEVDKFRSIKYCPLCIKRTANTRKLLKDLEKQILEAKSKIKSQLKENLQPCKSESNNYNIKNGNEATESEEQFASKILQELTSKMKSGLIMKMTSKNPKLRIKTKPIFNPKINICGKTKKDVKIPEIREEFESNTESENKNLPEDVTIKEESYDSALPNVHTITVQISEKNPDTEIEIPMNSAAELFTDCNKSGNIFADEYDEVEIKFESDAEIMDLNSPVKDPLEEFVMEAKVSQVKPKVKLKTIKKQVEKSFKCNTCEKLFAFKCRLIRHERIHNGEKRFNCQYCQRTFKLKVDLESHELTHGGRKAYKCKYCEMRFKGREKLKRHERIHTGEKPYRCHHCEKAFRCDNGLRQHQRTHLTLHSKRKQKIGTSSRSSRKLEDPNCLDTTKTHMCQYCPKIFERSTGLKMHELIHTADKPYACKYCDKRFRMRFHFNAHERTHTGERPFLCQYCEKRFKQRQTLNNHERLHTGHKPFLCQYCKKGFAVKGAVKIHELIHGTEKPFKCGYCDKAFIRKDKLIAHERTHTGEKPYKNKR